MKENNFGTEEKDKFANLIEKTNSQTIIIIFLCIIVLALILGILNMQMNVKVELPPKFISDNTEQIKIDISNDKATADYYKMWGYYYINETANFKSKEISKKIGLIKKAYESKRLKKERKEIDENGKEYSTTDEKKLDEFVKNIKKEKVSQSFTPTDVHKPILLYDNSEASLTIDGVADQIFEKMPKDPITKDKACFYEIKLNRKGGNTYVIGYKTNCFD